MVISVSTVSPAPPKSWYSGAPKRWAYKSYTAISTAALAEVFFTMLECSLYIMPSKSSISMPSKAGRIKSSMAQRMLPLVSPVITAVGGASPYPAAPVSVVIRTTISSTFSTVRSAVLKGFASGTNISPTSISVIFILLYCSSSRNTLALYSGYKLQPVYQTAHTITSFFLRLYNILTNSLRIFIQH